MSIVKPPLFFGTLYNPGHFQALSSADDLRNKVNAVDGHAYNTSLESPTLLNATFEGTTTGLNYATPSELDSVAANLDSLNDIVGDLVPTNPYNSFQLFNGPLDVAVTALNKKNIVVNMTNGDLTLTLPAPTSADAGKRFSIFALVEFVISAHTLTIAVDGGLNRIQLPNSPGVLVNEYVFPHEQFWVDVVVFQNNYIVSPCLI